ncbi:hypothetical protein [Streptomyces sp. NPDC001970]
MDGVPPHKGRALPQLLTYMYAQRRTADRRELTAGTTRTDRIATLADKISGRH